MTLATLRREARGAAASARRNLVPGTVKAVHNGDSELARLAGSTPGQPLYTVTVVGRRFQEFDLFPVASAIPVQVGHRVFVSFIDGDLSRGAWITGLTHPPLPQTLSVRHDMTTALSDHLLSDPTQPHVVSAGNLLARYDDAITVTEGHTRLAFDLQLATMRGEHEVELSGLTTWLGGHSINSSAPGPGMDPDHDHTADAHESHLIIPIGGSATLTGSLGGVSLAWLAEARLVDVDADGTRVPLGSSSHYWLPRGVITDGTVSDSAAGERVWLFTDQIVSPNAVWSGAFDTRRSLGRSVALELYLLGAFVNVNEFTLPATWEFRHQISSTSRPPRSASVPASRRRHSRRKRMATVTHKTNRLDLLAREKLGSASEATRRSIIRLNAQRFADRPTFWLWEGETILTAAPTPSA